MEGQAGRAQFSEPLNAGEGIREDSEVRGDRPCNFFFVLFCLLSPSPALVCFI